MWHRRGSLAVAASFLSLVSTGLAQPPGGPGGFRGPGEFPGGLPQVGQIFLPGFLQDRLKPTAEQKRKLEELQKQVDAELSRILTPDQQKTLNEARRNPFGGLGIPPGFPGPGGFGPPGGGPGGKGAQPGKGAPGGFGFPGPGLFGAFGATASLDDVKKELGATDEEWQVIGPQLRKVDAARRALLGLAPAAGPMAGNALSQAQAELRALLADAKHSRDEVQELMTAVRNARDKTRVELAGAQRELRLLLTEAQQAVAVSLGYLD